MKTRSLVSQSNWMVSNQVFPISVLGLAVGVYLDSDYLMLGGAVLLGVAIAPLLPVWTEKRGQHAIKFREYAKSIKGFPIYYWCLVSFVVLGSISGLIGKIFG